MKIINKNHYHWQIPLLTGLILLQIELWTQPFNFGDSIQICIFVALLWYSFETRELKLSSKLNNELEQKPIVDLFFRPATADHEEYFRLRNSGKGVAYEIQVRPIVIERKRFKFYFDDPNLILTPLDDEKTLYIDAWDGNNHLGEGQLDFFKNTISPPTIHDKNDLKEAKFIITYENAGDEKFYKIFKFYCTTPATDDFQVKPLKQGKM
ncbi:MAG: hypothetical protein WC650_00115 [Candidatus Doudnabacteria bacterium]